MKPFEKVFADFYAAVGSLPADVARAKLTSISKAGEYLTDLYTIDVAEAERPTLPAKSK